MQELVKVVNQLYRSWKGVDPAKVDILPLSGSDRRYFRLYDEQGQTVIAIHDIENRI